MATFFELFCECKDSLQKYEQALSEARVLSLSNDTESGHLTAFVRFPRLVSDRMLREIASVITAQFGGSVRLSIEPRFDKSLCTEAYAPEIKAYLKKTVAVTNGFLEGSDWKIDENGVFAHLKHGGLAILEQAAEHASGENWLDSKYTARRLSRRVYIRLDDSAAYRDDETTPIQEVYREVRRAIQNSRAIATDPRNGYSYLEELTADGLDTIYFRLQKYADLGGYNADGLYTTDRQSVADYETIIEKLELTDRQAQIVRLRMQGKGYKQIATYLGVTFQAVQNAMKKVQAKAEKIGFRPDAE